MFRPLLVTLLWVGPALAQADAGVVVEEAVADAGATLAEVVSSPGAAVEPERDDDDGDGDGDESADDGVEAEVQAQLDAALADAGILYTADLSDDELLKRWTEAPESLGSISVGLTEAGRLINGVPMPRGEGWQVVDPVNAWGAQETIDFLVASIKAVREQFKDAPPLRVNHIARKNGGYLRPHQSHQAGRDVDLGFLYPRGEDPGRLRRKRELAMDLPMNWALLRALLVHGDVEFVLVDKRIQRRLYDYALSQGEDKAWLDRVFLAGNQSMVRHARRHRDHFHVRYFAARSQELGRRITPLLAKQPEQNLVIHRVKKGDTLGRIASRYNSAVKLIQKANGLTSHSLKVGRTLNIPLRGPCTSCPVPPPLVVPPRCLPPEAPRKS